MQVRAPPPRCAPRAWCTRRAEPVRTLGFLETCLLGAVVRTSRINTAPVSCLLGSLSTGGWGLGDRALSRCPARDPYGACLTHFVGSSREASAGVSGMSWIPRDPSVNT